MKHRKLAGAVLLSCTIAFGCNDSGTQTGPGPTVKLFVDSDPRGAPILVDGVATTQTTPDTLRTLTDANHTIGAQQTVSGVVYGSAVTVGKGVIPASVVLPLVARCGSVACVNSATSLATSGIMKFGVNALGFVFATSATAGGGLIWPSTSHNNYASQGAPVFAAIPTGSTTPLGLGVYTFTADYPVPYWAARPTNPPLVDPAAITQLTSWIIPPPLFQTLNTARGLEVMQEVSAVPGVSDVLAIRIVFRNITNRASYRTLDSLVPTTGITYDPAYVGYGIDPDIGTAGDEYVTYAPDLNTVFAYDADFRENAFEVDAEKPGLLGLRLLSAPAGTKVILNNWPIVSTNGIALDWMPQNNNELFGYNVLGRMPTTLLAYTSADTRVGHVGTVAGDYRMSVSAGPLRLQPGDSAVIKVAVMLASPVAGTFVSARDLPPGDPTDANRPIMKTAENLLQKARQAATIIF